MPDQDVNPASDPSADATPVEPVVQTSIDGSGSVTPVPGDRPVENAVAEFHRKFSRMQSQLDAVTQYLTQSATAARPASAAPAADLSDDDLWRLAQQGDRQAFDLYMGRQAMRTSQSVVQSDRQARLIDAQLAQLGQMYPVLNDSQHALTQTVQQAYHLLLGQGYPASRATLLDATKTAIADRPDLVVELRGQATVTRDAGRRSATQVAQAGQMGASSRPSPAPAPAPRVKPLSKEEIELAKRMGIKDPQKAKERFLQRQASGQSALGGVGIHVREEDL